ncbi:hypothetical protein E2I00_005068, partial [Balaenoptera physalus]
MWRPNHQPSVGLRGESSKLKSQKNYKKLLRQEVKAQTSEEWKFTDLYPDHLKHLYLDVEERLRKPPRNVDQSLSEEQVDQPFIDQTLSEEYCSFEQPQPEEQCSIRVNSLAIPKKNKKKTSNQTAQEECEQVQAKHAIKEQELGGKKREKQLKGSTKKG